MIFCYCYARNFPCFCLADPLSLVRDHRIKELLSSRGLTVRSFNADLLYEPWEVADENGCPFSTFEPFWNKCLSMPYDPAAPLLPPKRIISGMFDLIFLSVFSSFIFANISNKLSLHIYVPLLICYHGEASKKRERRKHFL